MKTSSGLLLVLHFGELYNYFILYYNVIIIEIKCTVNVMRLNHRETIPLHPRSMEKLSSTKLVLGATKVGERCSGGQKSHFLCLNLMSELPHCTSISHPCLHIGITQGTLRIQMPGSQSFGGGPGRPECSEG